MGTVYTLEPSSNQQTVMDIYQRQSTIIQTGKGIFRKGQLMRFCKKELLHFLDFDMQADTMIKKFEENGYQEKNLMRFKTEVRNSEERQEHRTLYRCSLYCWF